MASSNLENSMDDDDKPLLRRVDSSSDLIVGEISEVNVCTVWWRCSRIDIRIIRIAVMAFVFVSLASYNGIMSTSMLDLELMFHSNIGRLSDAMTLKAVGILCGSLTGAIISSRHHEWHNVILGVLCMIAGASCAVIPWSYNLLVMGTVFFVQGICHGTIVVLLSTLVIVEWGRKSAVAMNLLHTFYSIGALLTPLITGQFVCDTAGRNDTITSPNVTILYQWQQTFNYPIQSEIAREHNVILCVNSSLHSYAARVQSRIFIPYSLFAGFGVTIGLLFLILHRCSKAQNDDVEQVDNGHGTVCELTAQTDKCFTITVSIGLLIIYVTMMSRDRCMLLYDFIIAVNSSVMMPTAQAVLYSTTFNASIMIGRIISTILSIFIKVHWLVFGSVILSMIDVSLLAIFGLKSELWFWLLTCGTGLFSAPLYASIMTWANEYVKVRGAIIATIDIGIGLGGFLAIWLGGYLLDNVGAQAVMIQLTCSSALLTVSVVILQIICSIRGAHMPDTLQ